jgi:hypothetical protein
MNPPIYFNDQFRFMAIKIRNEPANDMLAAEMATRDFIPPELRPQQAFGIRHFPPHSPGFPIDTVWNSL